MDTLVNAVGILYGLALVLAAFARNRITEALRVDALFIPQFSEKTRPINLLVGLLIAGYSAYSLLAR